MVPGVDVLPQRDGGGATIGAGWGHTAVVDSRGGLVVFGRPNDIKNTMKTDGIWRSLPIMVRLFNALGVHSLNTVPDDLEAEASEDEAASRGGVPKHVAGSLVPVRVSLRSQLKPGEAVASVECSAAVTAVLTTAGRIISFGRNQFGQCGVGSQAVDVFLPREASAFAFSLALARSFSRGNQSIA